jgi:hypothetical protein
MASAICCELLPVSCLDGQAVLLRFPASQDGRGDTDPDPAAASHGQWAWRVPCGELDDPGRLALGALRSALLLAGVGDGGSDAPLPDGLVLHSTSWRYDPDERVLVLTFLAVVPAAVARAWIRAGALPVPVKAVEVQVARGDRLRPPPVVRVGQVLAHALDHLAFLAVTDPAIGAALEEGWRLLLRARQPRPAGALGAAARDAGVAAVAPAALPSASTG